ncbi:MAG: hypothetical protein K5925_00420 [Bacilli bacterium]|nr:hypothetical protein [Bacilli bacterium]
MNNNEEYKEDKKDRRKIVLRILSYVILILIIIALFILSTLFKIRDNGDTTDFKSRNNTLLEIANKTGELEDDEEVKELISLHYEDDKFYYCAFNDTYAYSVEVKLSLEDKNVKNAYLYVTDRTYLDLEVSMKKLTIEEKNIDDENYQRYILGKFTTTSRVYSSYIDKDSNNIYYIHNALLSDITTGSSQIHELKKSDFLYGAYIDILK